MNKNSKFYFDNLRQHNFLLCSMFFFCDWNSNNVFFNLSALWELNYFDCHWSFGLLKVRSNRLFEVINVCKVLCHSIEKREKSVSPLLICHDVQQKNWLQLFQLHASVLLHKEVSSHHFGTTKMRSTIHPKGKPATKKSKIDQQKQSQKLIKANNRIHKNSLFHFHRRHFLNSRNDLVQTLSRKQSIMRERESRKCSQNSGWLCFPQCKQQVPSKKLGFCCSNRFRLRLDQSQPANFL